MHRAFRTFSLSVESVVPRPPEHTTADREVGLCKVLTVLGAFWQ
jgi:hypothetical protein